jgi:hypothetical protein
MNQSLKTTSRKKILLWGAALLSSATVFRFFTGSKKIDRISCAPPNETIKMLTEDGKLVEINKTLLASSGKKISNEELQKWIKK